MNRFAGFSLAVVLAAAPVALEAQEAPGHRPVRPVGAAVLAQRAELGLTAEQVSRIEAIAERLRTENAPLMEQLRTSDAFRGHTRAMSGDSSRRARMQRQMRDITPEQRAERRARLAERRAEMRPEQRERLEQRRALMRDRQEQMRERLSTLTQEEREQLRSDRRARRTERAPRVDRALPEELRTVVEQLRTNRQQASREIRDVLTAEQEARLQELAQERRTNAGERMRRGSARWQNR